MFIDARRFRGEGPIETDICVIGAGAAGITLALGLDGCDQRVLVLESGGFEPDPATQTLYRGENDNPYSLPLDESRFRYFGGSTNRWAGWCRPLDRIDFESREWIPHSGWPFLRVEIEPWYQRAASVCELTGAGEIGAPQWKLNRIDIASFRLSPPTAFGKVYRDRLTRSSNVTVMLHANAALLVRGENGRVSRIACQTLQPSKFDILARTVVLAAGGVENARLLLASELGNEHDVVGRYYMDHPALFSGVFEPAADCPPMHAFTTEHVSNPGRSTRVTGGFTLSDGVARKERLAGAVTRFVPRPSHTMSDSWETPGSVSARRLAHSLRAGRLPEHALDHLGRAARDVTSVAKAFAGAATHIFNSRRAVALRSWVECVPDPENRVTLSRKRNALGPVARVTWKTHSLEKRSLIRLQAILGDELNKLGFGKITPSLTDESAPWPPSQQGASHHMGTTRMHDSPTQGVVDRNCRVFGCENLFIAGSSLFPTSGYANPTFTIVALALRLASHLRNYPRS